LNGVPKTIGKGKKPKDKKCYKKKFTNKYKEETI